MNIENKEEVQKVLALTGLDKLPQLTAKDLLAMSTLSGSDAMEVLESLSDDSKADAMLKLLGDEMVAASSNINNPYINLSLSDADIAEDIKRGHITVKSLATLMTALKNFTAFVDARTDALEKLQEYKSGVVEDCAAVTKQGEVI